MDDDTFTSEGRFGDRRVQEYSGWASVAAIALAIIAMALVFYFQADAPGSIITWFRGAFH
jgi:hypothetical protein